MPKPGISVCVPTYNGAAFLSQTLQSISDQTFQDYEVVIVDDNSRDDTVAIAERYAATDPRVRVFRYTESSGSSGLNANRCLTHARGEWIKFIFQDDLMAPTCLEQMLQAGTAGDFVICWHDYIFEAGVVTDVRRMYETARSLRKTFDTTYVTPENFSDEIAKRWYENFIGPTSASFIHSDCFVRYGAFSSRITAFPDRECWIRIGNQEGLAIVPEYLVTFRVHADSLSARIRTDEKLLYDRSLQHLLLLRTMAESAQYANVRAAFHRAARPLSPTALLAQETARLRWLAVDTKYHKRDASLYAQWKAFCREHPEFQEVLTRIDAGVPLTTKIRQFIKARL